MNTVEALKILGLDQVDFFVQVKKAYKVQSTKFHPDREGGSQERMKLINNAYDLLKNIFAKNPKFTYKPSQSSKISEDYQLIIDEISDIDGLEIEICGTWLWVRGDTKPHKEKLKEAGLRYHATKKCWFLKPNEERKRWSKGEIDMDAIRSKYGSSTIKAKKKRKKKTSKLTALPC